MRQRILMQEQARVLEGMEPTSSSFPPSSCLFRITALRLSKHCHIDYFPSERLWP